MRNLIISAAQLENNCITKNTKYRYNSTSYQFVLWLYNNRATYKGFICPTLIITINGVLASNMTEKKKKAEIRKNIVGWLSQMTQGRPEQYPINMNKIDYDVVALYMAQKTKGGGGREEGVGNFMSKGSYCGIWLGVIFSIHNISNITASIVSQPNSHIIERIQKNYFGSKG
jgi:hypothetical protein